MSRSLTMLFAIFCYAVFFATFLYLIIFVGDFPLGVRTVDVGPEALPMTAAVIDLALVTLFGLQHSIMARPAFKARWTRIVPVSAERSAYVLAASIVLMILFIGWRPIDQIVWNLRSPVLKDFAWLTFWLGWAIVLISTFLINHLELFGLQQAWLTLRGREADKPELRQPMFYRWVAHPLYAGFFLAFWAAPEMTLGHLLLAAAMSAYMLVAIRYEERDLTDVFGEEYRRYRSGVGGLIPRFTKRGA